jgi:hypothetical protein
MKVWQFKQLNKTDINSAQNSSRHMVVDLLVDSKAISLRSTSKITRTWKKRTWAVDLKITWIRFRKLPTRSFKKNTRWHTRGSYRPIIIVLATFTLSLLKIVNVKKIIQTCYTNHRRLKSCSSTHVILKSRQVKQHPLQAHIFTKLAEANTHLLQANQNLPTNQLPKRTSLNRLVARFPVFHNKTPRLVKQDKSPPKSDNHQQSPTSQFWTHPTLLIRPCYQSPSAEIQQGQWAPKRRAWQTPNTSLFPRKAILAKERLQLGPETLCNSMVASTTPDRAQIQILHFKKRLWRQNIESEIKKIQKSIEKICL